MSGPSADELWHLLQDLDLIGQYRFLAQQFPGRIAFSTSFGQEDQVVTHQVLSNDVRVEVFTLDTGRMFQETYDVWDRTEKRYSRKIRAFAPDQQALQELLTAQGPNGFYESVANRKACCFVRKVAPLKLALKEVDLWITGLRSGQSANRAEVLPLEWDEGFGLLKFNPLHDWSLERIQQYLETYNVPQNTLHRRGFPSIGCAPCTRAISPGEDIRAGRWWWESSQKECGLHAPQPVSNIQEEGA